jgi:RHS repeat-associated protein
MNRLIEVKDAEDNFTHYGYDEGHPERGSRGLLSSITDARGKLTTFSYDEVGQLRELTYPLGQKKSFGYYLNRNLKSITTPNGDLIRFSYDDAGQLREKHLPEGIVSYDYDDTGNLTYADNGASVIDLLYDLAGRLRHAKTSLSSHQPATAIAYEKYDKVANRLTMNDGTGITTYTYDKTNQLTHINGPIGHTGYGYDGLGRRKALALPNGIASAYTYDDAGRLTDLTNEGVSQFEYPEHDNVGNRRTMISADGVHSYTYDGIYELTGAGHPQSPPETYTYDRVGNRTSSRDHPDWHYDDNNRLTGHDGTTYTHDENGNILTKTDATGSTIYEYDSENRLIRITDPEQRVTTYTYDGLGRRIEKDVGGTITRYVFDLEDILFEYDGNNTLRARYTHGPGIDDPIAMERGGQSYFYHTDGLGSITHITDSSKQIVSSYSYDAFGNITSKTGSLTNPYTYTGREYDPESGFYYYRARYYDPEIGRFLQPDPLDMAMVILIRQYFPGSPMSGVLYQYALKTPIFISNVYPYCLNNPVNLIDPDGFVVLTVPGAIFGGVAGGVYSIISQIGKPGGIEWGRVVEAAITGAGFGAITGATFGIGSAIVYGFGAGYAAGVFANVFVYDYPNAVHYPRENGPCD